MVLHMGIYDFQSNDSIGPILCHENISSKIMCNYNHFFDMRFCSFSLNWTRRTSQKKSSLSSLHTTLIGIFIKYWSFSEKRKMTSPLFNVHVLQLREFRESNLTNPCNNKEKSMYQFWQIHVTSMYFVSQTSFPIGECQWRRVGRGEGCLRGEQNLFIYLVLCFIFQAPFTL